MYANASPYRVLAPELPLFKPRDLAQSLWALQRLRHLPSMEWVLQLHALLRVRVPLFDTPSLVVVLRALAGLSPVYQVCFVCVCVCVCVVCGVCVLREWVCVCERANGNPHV